MPIIPRTHPQGLFLFEQFLAHGAWKFVSFFHRAVYVRMHIPDVDAQRFLIGRHPSTMFTCRAGRIMAPNVIFQCVQMLEPFLAQIALHAMIDVRVHHLIVALVRFGALEKTGAYVAHGRITIVVHFLNVHAQIGGQHETLFAIAFRAHERSFLFHRMLHFQMSVEQMLFCKQTTALLALVSTFVDRNMIKCDVITKAYIVFEAFIARVASEN